MTNAPVLPASAADDTAHIDHAVELMVVLDAGGRIARANAAAGDILGYAPEAGIYPTATAAPSAYP